MKAVLLFARHFDDRCLASTRAAFHRGASEHGLSGERLTDFLMAVNECVINVLAHGGGHGSLRLWREDDGLLCEVEDTGAGIPARTLAEGSLPPPGAPGGRGIWLMRRLADEVGFVTGPQGTIVRLRMRVEPARRPAIGSGTSEGRARCAGTRCRRDGRGR
ncbi:ATP-binding protein [Nonomuraea sp. NPDC048892]|uniref:ATP-binding protein n=1 Tax=Nonomuraea sp. NPDC048892 TaxID=3154624 RepID=UPI0034017F41